MLLYWILLPIVWVLAHIVFRIQVIGRENLKAVRDGRGLPKTYNKSKRKHTSKETVMESDNKFENVCLKLFFLPDSSVQSFQFGGAVL